MLPRGERLLLALLGALYGAKGKKLAPELVENCTYFREPPYKKAFRNRKDDIEVLGRDFGLRCTPKPKGAITSIGFVDTGKARELLDTYGDDVWLQNEFRQQQFKPHQHTQSVLMLWKRDLLTDILEFPRWKDWETIFQPVVKAFAEKMGYDIEEVDVWKAMLARLRPGTEISPHRDSSIALAYPHRVHWVLETEPGMVMTFIGDEMLDLQPDFVFEFNNVERHGISHRGEKWRVHAILDIVPKKTHPHRPVSATAWVKDEL